MRALDGKAMELDSLRFGLTGGVFSRSPATVKAVDRLSGVGSKAGGPDYLLQFVEPRVLTESTVRH